MGISPEIEKVYGQLLWVDRRRLRTVAAVASHFGRATVERLLKEHTGPSPLNGEPDFSSLVDDRDTEAFLADLAHRVLALEASTISCLRSHVSVYQQHVDEQILFGIRTSGQEAGRAFMAQAKPSAVRMERLDIPEAIQAVLELTFQGLPGERNHFLCLRSHGGSTLHFSRSPYLEAWRQAGADAKFLHLTRGEWIRGILDILSPETDYSCPLSLEEGHPYGLAQFHLRGIHAGP